MGFFYKAFTLCCFLFIGLFFITGCTSSGMYPANILITGLPAANVTAEVLNCYQNEDTLFILIKERTRERLVSVYPWDPEIKIGYVNRMSANSYGWDNGHSTLLHLYYQTDNKRQKRVTIGKNVRINTPVFGDVKIQIGPASKAHEQWLQARLVGGRSGIKKTVDAGEAAVLKIEEERWKFILFGAQLPLDKQDAKINPTVFFNASFVLYIPFDEEP